MDKLYPAAVSADQEMIVSGNQERTVLGPPPFSSPNPATEARRMLPLEDGTSAHVASLEAHEQREAGKGSDYSSMDAKALKALVEERDLTPESNKKADLIAALQEDDASDYKAADFKQLVEAASSQEELDQAAELYEASGKSYSSVESAIEKKQDEINEADNGQGQ